MSVVMISGTWTVTGSRPAPEQVREGPACSGRNTVQIDVMS